MASPGAGVLLASNVIRELGRGRLPRLEPHDLGGQPRALPSAVSTDAAASVKASSAVRRTTAAARFDFSASAISARAFFSAAFTFPAAVSSAARTPLRGVPLRRFDPLAVEAFGVPDALLQPFDAVRVLVRALLAEPGPRQPETFADFRVVAVLQPPHLRAVTVDIPPRSAPPQTRSTPRKLSDRRNNGAHRVDGGGRDRSGWLRMADATAAGRYSSGFFKYPWVGNPGMHRKPGLQPANRTGTHRRAGGMRNAADRTPASSARYPPPGTGQGDRRHDQSDGHAAACRRPCNTGRDPNRGREPNRRAAAESKCAPQSA